MRGRSIHRHSLVWPGRFQSTLMPRASHQEVTWQGQSPRTDALRHAAFNASPVDAGYILAHFLDEESFPVVLGLEVERIVPEELFHIVDGIE
ncbi:MAG: hypothetical protein ACOYM3_24660 [Terrimicrobiaceae bacterium]